MSNTYIPERAMAIYAHPDDIDFSCAGTVAKWAQHGCQTTYVVITDGNVGSHEDGMTAEKLAEIRHAEQRAAADLAGATCVFLGYHDGLLEPTAELRKELVRLIRIHKPNVIFSGDPNMYYRGERPNHPDHRAAAQATFAAAFPACEMPLLYPEFLEEGITPHKVNFIYMTTDKDKNCYVDISETVDQKVAALQQHESQLSHLDLDPLIKQRAAAVGKEVGFEYAESFRRITITPVE